MKKKKQKLEPAIVQACLHFYDNSPLVSWTVSMVVEPSLVLGRIGVGVEPDEEQLKKLIINWERAGIQVIGQRRTNEDKWIGPKPWRYFKRFRAIKKSLE